MHGVLGVAVGARMFWVVSLSVVSVVQLSAGPLWKGTVAPFDICRVALHVCTAAALSVVHAVSDTGSALLWSPTHAPGMDLSIATYQPMLSTALAPKGRISINIYLSYVIWELKGGFQCDTKDVPNGTKAPSLDWIECVIRQASLPWPAF
jgi:hypothetical protein